MTDDALPWGHTAYDHMPVAMMVHDFAVTRGDLSEQYARDQLSNAIERKIAHVITGVRAWCAINEIAEPPLDWEGLGEFLTTVTTPGQVTP